MFLLRLPSDDQVVAHLEAQAALPFTYPGVGSTRDAVDLPPGWQVDHARAPLGRGDVCWAAAVDALTRWAMFDQGWVRVHDPALPIVEGAVAGIIVRSLGLTVLAAARIVYVLDEPHRFGFAYGTLPGHVERGEERFSVERDPATGEVFHDLLACSRPGHPLAWLGYPWTRSQQRRFARGSMAAMQAACR